MYGLGNIPQTILLFLPTNYASAVYESYKLQNEPLVLLMIAIVFYHPLMSAAFFCRLGRQSSSILLPAAGVLSGSGAMI
jgi:hypothetical protein